MASALDVVHPEGEGKRKSELQNVITSNVQQIKWLPPIILHGRLGQWLPYNIVPDSFHTGVTAEALWTEIEQKSTISHQRGHFDPKFQVQGVASHQSFLHR